MLFNSVAFAVFLPTVFFLYWFVAGRWLKAQNLLLLAASCFFYGFWEWHFLLLLAFSTCLDFFTGLRIFHSGSEGRKKLWLYISVFTNLGFLGVFKYYNFFAQSFAGLLGTVGIKADVITLKVLLPAGISFYTFHGLSYVFDI
jgi:alginate O-acetyltransferase complex protein AlgI